MATAMYSAILSWLRDLITLVYRTPARDRYKTMWQLARAMAAWAHRQIGKIVKSQSLKSMCSLHVQPIELALHYLKGGRKIKLAVSVSLIQRPDYIKISYLVLETPHAYVN